MLFYFLFLLITLSIINSNNFIIPISYFSKLEICPKIILLLTANSKDSSSDTISLLSLFVFKSYLFLIKANTGYV